MSEVKTKRLILGITGGIASGKSTVMRALARAGIPTVSSDVLAHQAIFKATSVHRRILRRYGRGILRSSGQISRRTLGHIVFRDPAERRWLERQVHPVVIRTLKQFIRAHHGIVALDIPLLFEARLQNLVDKVIVVYSSRELQIKRLRRRDGLSRQNALQRIAAQIPLGAKRRHADIVLDNRGTPPALRSQIRRLLKDLNRT